ncbi:8.6 kDa transglutaminase substrate-like [Uloborus diversus]|uniref:8.6 kDa transglutaminase substrate-like n=1 Tax=Uloborus diversus TaxID=327109 RepID=UPI002409B86E|nr:8.6 kDa transglutaminase substrate-like [Uloborus diversus]
MNSLLYLIVLGMICIKIADVECFSEPVCGNCNPAQCPQTPNCRCGQHLDYCGCCAFCSRCPGETCNLVAMERCAYGRTCTPPPGANPMTIYGTCQ